MAIVPMADAVTGNIASSLEYNKIIDNVLDLDVRLGSGVGTTSNTTTGTATAQLTSLRTRMTTEESNVDNLQTLTTNTSGTVGIGNQRLSDRLGAGITTANTAASQISANAAAISTLDTRIGSFLDTTNTASTRIIELRARPVFGARLNVAGRWGVPQFAGYPTIMTSSGYAAERELAIPLHVSLAGSIDRIALRITTGGGAGTTIRLGVRADSQGPYPGALLLDAGTISGTTIGTIEKTLAAPLALTPGLYWLTFTVQTSTAPLPSMHAFANGITYPVMASTSVEALASAGMSGYITTVAVPGALPGAYPASTSQVMSPAISYRSA